MEQPIKNNDSM